MAKTHQELFLKAIIQAHFTNKFISFKAQYFNITVLNWERSKNAGRKYLSIISVADLLCNTYINIYIEYICMQNIYNIYNNYM